MTFGAFRRRFAALLQWRSRRGGPIPAGEKLTNALTPVDRASGDRTADGLALLSRSQTRRELRQGVRLSEIIAALSYALDLTEGQPLGHSVRTCILGMRIAAHLGLPEPEKKELYYALLLKDAGCSSNASRLYQIIRSDERSAKRDVKTQDWTRVTWESLQYLKNHVKPGRPALERLVAVVQMAVNREAQAHELFQTRCERGAAITRKMGFPEKTCQAIRSLDEHWNGKGQAGHLSGNDIPLFSRIMNLCQTIEVFFQIEGPGIAIETAKQRSGRWFDPQLVKIVQDWKAEHAIWSELEDDAAREIVKELAPAEDRQGVDEERLDSICEAFADVIDAKSPFTFRHSTGVAAAAVAASRQMGFDAEIETTMRRAALLHDIGKLSVSNAILEKPGKLTGAEWEVVRLHPYYTQRILEKVPVFCDFAEIASAHHEKLDGSGYYRNLSAEQLSTEARLLAVADIYDALAADRPYRQGLPAWQAFAIIEKEVPLKLDPECFEALKAAVKE